MRRFRLGWKQLGHARRFRAEVVNFADDICIVGGKDAVGSEPNHEASETAVQRGHDPMFAMSTRNAEVCWL